MADNLMLARYLEPQALGVLAHYDLPEPASLRLLTFSENAVYRADFCDHPPVVVRLHSIGYHTRQEIASELAWVDALGRDVALREGGVRTPGVLRSRDERPVVTAAHPGLPARFAVVFEWLDGKSPEGAADAAGFRMLGATTALLHEHALAWTPPTWFSRFSWDYAGTIGHSPHWGDWRDGPGMDADIKAILERAAGLVTRRLAAFARGRDRYGLIHSDLRLANVLLADGNVQVIDFDDCGAGWLLYDLAGALSFMEEDPAVPDLVSAWVEGYRQVRALAARDEAEIPTFLMLRRLVIFAWLGSRPATDIVDELGASYAHGTAELAEHYLSTKGGRC